MSDGAAKPGPEHPLENIVDDEEALSKCHRWAYDQLSKGRTCEEVAAELEATGWDAQEAADIAEQARQKTRHLRGVMTRQDVVRQANERYRKTMGLNWFSSLVNLICFWRLMGSLAFLFEGWMGKKHRGSVDRAAQEARGKPTRLNNEEGKPRSIDR